MLDIMSPEGRSDGDETASRPILVVTIYHYIDCTSVEVTGVSTKQQLSRGSQIYALQINLI
jgi:hypothetical protein